MRYPALQGDPRGEPTPIGVADLMPTILSLAGVAIPEPVEGSNLSGLLLGTPGPMPSSAFIMSIAPFAECLEPEWRGVRTDRYTYVKTLQGPWLLYDNRADPYQLRNLVNDGEHEALREGLEMELQAWLKRTGDEFLPAEAYRQRWGLVVDAQNAVPYTD